MTLHVVTGPPCVGKTTYVRTHAQHGDIIIDLDSIAAALTTNDTASHDYPDHVRTVAQAARKAAIAAAVPASRALNVWLIETAPTPKQRGLYANYRAQFIELTATHHELTTRAATRPTSNQARITAYWQRRTGPGGTHRTYVKAP